MTALQREIPMTLSLYDSSVPLFARGLEAVPAWLDKALAEGKDEAAILAARLAPDMRPFTAQIQMASDSAKNAVARLMAVEPPSMPDTEASLAELKDRCERTLAFVKGAAREAVEAGAARPVELRFPNGMGFRFPTGADYMTRFALPNFFFHLTTAYGLLRRPG